MLTPGDIVYSVGNSKKDKYKIVKVTGNTVSIETTGAEKLIIENVRAELLVVVDKTYICSHCSRKLRSTPKPIKGNIYCSECSKSLKECGNCGEMRVTLGTHLNWDRTKVINLCTPCRENTGTCVNCGLRFTSSNMMKVDGRDFCTVCGDLVKYPQYQGRRRAYNYLPDRFDLKGKEKSGLYLGIELECANVLHKRHNDVVCGLLEEDSDRFLYGMWDSSINATSPGAKDGGDGVEVVSHPASLTYWQSHPELVQTIMRLRDWGFRSYNAKQCGMHVHLSRNAFTVESLTKFLSIFYDNPAFWARLSEKPKAVLQRYASFNMPRETQVDIATTGANTPSKYMVVRATRSTIEVRPFIGALDETYFYKTLEISHAVYSYCSLSLKSASIGGFLKYIMSSQRAKRYEHAQLFLADRLRGTEWEKYIPNDIPITPLKLNPCA